MTPKMTEAIAGGHGLLAIAYLLQSAKGAEAATHPSLRLCKSFLKVVQDAKDDIMPMLLLYRTVVNGMMRKKSQPMLSTEG